MTEANPDSDSYAALPGRLSPDKAEFRVGVVTPPLVSCGYGNSSHYSSLAKSFAMKGMQVFTGQQSELLANPGIDFIVGVETVYRDVPKRLRNHAYTIDYAALAKKVCKGSIFSQAPEGKMAFGYDWDVQKDRPNFNGVRVIGYYSDAKGLETAMDNIEQDDDDHSFERTRFIDYAKSMFALADFTVEADKREIIRKSAEERKEHVDVAILLGGAPPEGLKGLVNYCIGLMHDLCKRDVSVALYAGEVQDNSSRIAIEALKPTHPVYGKIPYPNYMRAISGAKLIVTKPGWNTVSDLAYLSQCIPESKPHPHYMFLSDDYSIPEIVAQDVLERKGFEFIANTRYPQEAGTRIETMLSTEGLFERASKHTRQLCSNLKVKSIVDLILESESKEAHLKI